MSNAAFVLPTSDALNPVYCEVPWIFDADAEITGVVTGYVDLPDGVVKHLAGETDAGDPIKIPTALKQDAAKDLIEAAKMWLLQTNAVAR